MGIDEKNDAILNLDRQLREKTQKIEQVRREFRKVRFIRLFIQLQIDLQRINRQIENQQITSNKTIQTLKVIFLCFKNSIYSVFFLHHK